MRPAITFLNIQLSNSRIFLWQDKEKPHQKERRLLTVSSHTISPRMLFYYRLDLSWGIIFK